MQIGNDEAAHKWEIQMPRKQAIGRRMHSGRLERAKIVPRGTD
jgi:hypothetical protein